MHSNEATRSYKRFFGIQLKQFGSQPILGNNGSIELRTFISKIPLTRDDQEDRILRVKDRMETKVSFIRRSSLELSAAVLQSSNPSWDKKKFCSDLQLDLRSKHHVVGSPT